VSKIHFYTNTRNKLKFGESRFRKFVNNIYLFLDVFRNEEKL